MTPAQLLAATAADMRKVADDATDGPWFFNGYCGVFSKPLSDAYDPWMELLVDAGHELERRGECRACESSNGCQHAEDAYAKDPAVAWVPPHHGDTAIGRRAADAVHIAAWSPKVTPMVAVLLDGIATRHVNTPLAGAVNPRGYCIGCGGYGGGWTCPDVTEAIELCDAWWKSRGMEPQAVKR